MKINNINGRRLVCQHMFIDDQIKPGQTWAPADGSDYTVTIISVIDGWVVYQYDKSDGAISTHEKDTFSFQVRYCLVVDPEQVDEILAMGV